MKVIKLLFLCASFFLLSDSKLVLVIHTFRYLLIKISLRHGARGPIYDNYDSKDQVYNAGELVPTGMRQHYNLGRQLRKEYIENLNFLSPAFNHEEIYIRSTNVNRTLMSAQSLFMGFFPNGASLPVELEEQYLLPAY